MSVCTCLSHGVARVLAMEEGDDEAGKVQEAAIARCSVVSVVYVRQSQLEGVMGRKMDTGSAGGCRVGCTRTRHIVKRFTAADTQHERICGSCSVLSV